MEKRHLPVHFCLYAVLSYFTSMYVMPLEPIHRSLSLFQVGSILLYLSTQLCFLVLFIFSWSSVLSCWMIFLWLQDPLLVCLLMYELSC